MTVIPLAMLLGILGAAVVSDLSHRRIPNLLVLAGLLMGVSWHLIGPPGSWSFDPRAPGAVGILGALLAAGVLLATFFPFYALRVMGAGDVKLIAAVGAIFGARPGDLSHLFGLALVVLAAGGMLSVARIASRRTGAAVWSNLRLILLDGAARLAGTTGRSFDPNRDTADRMPYALAIAAGSIFYAVGKWTGWLTVL